MIAPERPIATHPAPGLLGPACHEAGQPAPAAGPATPALRSANLFHDVAALAPLLMEQAQQGAWLDAYLLAAGLSQIVEDYLHPDPLLLGKVADVLSDLSMPLGGRAATMVRGARTAAVQATALSPARRRLAGWQARLTSLLDALADMMVQERPTHAPELVARSRALVAEVAAFPPDLLRTLGRLPSCFRSFDQQPADLATIVHHLAQRWPDRRRPLVVVGVRTSGSYLAPLYAGYLRAAGYRDVTTLTIRPDRALSGWEQRTLRDGLGRDALVLLTDDPPKSGRSIARAADDLVRLGVPETSIVLLLQLFGPADTLPSALHGYQRVLLTWDDWSIQARLEPAAVRAALARLVDPETQVGPVERLPLPPASSSRSHVRARYRVQITEHGQARDEQILVRGVGLGYFGRQPQVVAEALGGFLPRVYGVEDGLLYRTWVPGEPAVNTPAACSDEQLAETAVDYVAERRWALAVPKDISERLFGEWPAWEVASTTLSQVFGRGWMAARIPLVDPIVRRLLQVSAPTVIDANMAADTWLLDPDGDSPAVKVGFEAGIFRGDVELACYDPVSDLASLLASLDLADGTGERALTVSRLLRDGYQRMTGDVIGEERWLLYQLVRLWDEQRTIASTDGEARGRVDRARSRALQRYLTATFFADLTPSVDGPICALDVDGVLETSAPGFPGLTPASALALRSLVQHGYRPVLATGRSLDEVRERCRAYPLAGGVAEYGAVTYVAATGQVTDLLTDDARADLARLRAALADVDGVRLDPDYRHAIRAYRLGASGRRRGLSQDTVALALALAGCEGRLRAIPGDAQTDFVPAGIDKGAGLRALLADLPGSAARMAAPGGPPHGAAKIAALPEGIALAVGDTASDLPMLASARLGLAPAHADDTLRRAGVPIMRQPYQAGLAEAVGRLLGHRPGRCSACPPPALTPEARLLLGLLAVPEAGSWGIVRSALRLALTATRLYVHRRAPLQCSRADIHTGS